jgi:hypothetical protein
MLMKLSPVVIFTTALKTAFLQIFLRQGPMKTNLKYKKSASAYNFCTKYAAHKMLVELTPYKQKIGPSCQYLFLQFIPFFSHYDNYKKT